MTKLWKGICFGLLIECALIGIFVAAEMVQGTRWVFPYLAMVALPILAFTFPEKQKGRRR